MIFIIKLKCLLNNQKRMTRIVEGQEYCLDKSFSGCIIHTSSIITCPVNIVVIFPWSLECFTTSYWGYTAATVEPYTLLAKDLRWHASSTLECMHTKATACKQACKHACTSKFYWYRPTRLDTEVTERKIFKSLNHWRPLCGAEALLFKRLPRQ